MTRTARLLVLWSLLGAATQAQGQACAASDTSICMDGSCLCLPAFKGDLATMATQALDTLVQLRAPVLENWLLASRNAVFLDAQPVPDNIRRQLQGRLPDPVLDAARWQVSRGDTLNLGHVAMNYGNLLDGKTVQAITLVDVILFRSAADAETNLELWLHELTHVRQFMDWGVRGFAERYVAAPEHVEAEAHDAALQLLHQTTQDDD